MGSPRIPASWLGTPEQKGKDPEQKSADKDAKSQEALKVKRIYDELKAKGTGMAMQELVETLVSSLSQGFADGQEPSAESLATQADSIASALKEQTQVCYNKLIYTYSQFTY